MYSNLGLCSFTVQSPNLVTLRVYLGGFRISVGYSSYLTPLDH